MGFRFFTIKVDQFGILTFLKSINLVMSVPSLRWNSNVHMSSATLDVIVSCTTSPPWNESRKGKTKSFKLNPKEITYIHAKHSELAAVWHKSKTQKVKNKHKMNIF